MGREPLGFLSLVVALVTMYRKGDETQHASKEWCIKCKANVFKHSWNVFKEVCYQTIMKFANENVSKWTIKNYYREILSLLIRRIKFSIKYLLSKITKYATQ